MGFWNKWFQHENLSGGEISGSSLIRFGRYSDNNKSVAQTAIWFEVDRCFDEKKREEGLRLFFDYLKDPIEENVRVFPEPDGLRFELFQGSKMITGKSNAQHVRAEVEIAIVRQSSIPAFRRLLELNNTLTYVRAAMHDQTISLVFDVPLETASPTVLYFGLKELAVTADKQDDLLVSDFERLGAVDNLPIERFPENERLVKYAFLKTTMTRDLKLVESLNQDSFSGAIGYILLNLIYKIDYLIAPEGEVLHQLEHIHTQYWNQFETLTAVERNQKLNESLLHFLAIPEAQLMQGFYRAKATFPVTQPKPYDIIRESIYDALNNAKFYVEKKQDQIAFSIIEYGLAFAQYSFSLPKVCSNLFKLYMQINYANYFRELAFTENYYNGRDFDQDAIEQRIGIILNEYIEKYPMLVFNVAKLNYASLIAFNVSFLYEVAALNFTPR